MDNNINNQNNMQQQSNASVQQQVPVQNNYVDPRTVEAEVIGVLRKEKIGKPLLVIEMFGLIAVVLVALPFLMNMYNDENSSLHKLLYGVLNPGETEEVEEPIQEVEEKVYSLAEVQKIVNGYTYSYEGLTIQNVSTKDNVLSMDITNELQEINLNEEQEYILIYAQSDGSEQAAYFKLDGTYNYSQKEVKLSLANFKFNDNQAYYMKIVKYSSVTDYPKLTTPLTSDESGLASLTCTKTDDTSTRTLEYTFKTEYLIGIKDTYSYKYDQNNDAAYTKVLKSYQTKAAVYNNAGYTSSVSEDTFAEGNGFVYTSIIDVDLDEDKVASFNYPDTDYEYYQPNSYANVVYYSMTGKGYDCK